MPVMKTALLFVLGFVLVLLPGIVRADDPEGIEVQDLVWGEPVEFPPDTAMFFATGCFACDGGDAAIYRISRAGNAPTRIDLALAPRGPGNITGIAFSDDGNVLFASVIDNSACVGQPPPASCVRPISLELSQDGGMTWSVVGTLPDELGSAFPAFQAIAVVNGMPIYRQTYPRLTYYFVNGLELTANERALYLPGLKTARFIWDDATQTLTLRDGSRVNVPIGRPPPGWTTATTQPIGVVDDARHPPLVYWTPVRFTPGPYYLTTVDGSTLRGWRIDGMNARDITWLDDKFVAATLWPLAKINDSGTTVTIQLAQPVLLDFAAGVAHPLGDYFGKPPLIGRNSLVATSRRPFLRVLGPECLSVRAWADRIASEVSCAAAGVLLQPAGGARYEHGMEWRDVTLPNGNYGWVPREGVEG